MPNFRQLVRISGLYILLKLKKINFLPKILAFLALTLGLLTVVFYPTPVPSTSLTYFRNYQNLFVFSLTSFMQLSSDFYYCSSVEKPTIYYHHN